MPTSPRIILAGSKRDPIAGARPLTGQDAAPDPNQVTEVTISLRRKTAVPTWVTHKGVLNSEQVASDYGATASDFITIQKFAKAHGLQVVEESPLTCTAKVSGSIQNLEAAFGTKLRNVKLGESIYRERRGHITLPEDIASIVEGVFGLDNRRQANPRFRPSVGPLVAHSFSPVEIAKLYNFPAGDGTGQTIGIIELGGGFKQSDLNTYFDSLGLASPVVTAISVSGGQNLPAPSDPHDPDAEVMLDIEVAGAVAPKAAIKVYFAPNTDKGFLDAINKAIQDKVTVISISWGGPESSWTKASMLAFEKSFQTAASISIPVTVASGDNGSTDGTTALVVDFPSSAPHALACGGTHLEGGVTITLEVVWKNNGGATGGGVSAVFAKPVYQNGINVPPATVPGGGRGVPDVCGDAAPETGYKIRRDGQNIVVGGTSAVAPLWAGLIVRLAQKINHRVPFLNPILYANPGAFRDITVGNNDLGNGGGKYKAAVGWDACTGLGSPKGAAILIAVQGGGATTQHTTQHTTPNSSPLSTQHTTPHTTVHTTANTRPHTTQHTPPNTTAHTTAHTTQHTTVHTTPHTIPHTTQHTIRPTTLHTTNTPPHTTPTTPSPSSGSGAIGHPSAFNDWYQVPPAYEPSPLSPQYYAPSPVQAAASPATVVPPVPAPLAAFTGGGGGNADLVALVATVATVATTAITALTAITAIAAGNNK